MKLGIIGCGKIAEYHLSSMLKAGFELHSISGTINSSNAINLKKKFKINKVFSCTEDHIKSREYNALLFLTPPETTYKYLLNINKQVKILAEKPITFYSSRLKKLKNKRNIKIAFNRRQYKAIEIIKTQVDKNKIFLIELSIPESINFLKNNKYSIKSKNFREKFFNIFYNSIHIFDIIKYLVGKYNVLSIKQIKDKKNNLQGYTIHINSKKVKDIIIKSIFNSPDNFSLNAHSNTARYEMCPIESFSIYEGIKTIEPTSKYPLRRYLPIKIENHLESATKNNKPGFDRQAQAFFDFCNKKKTNLANVDDLLDSINLAEKIFR